MNAASLLLCRDDNLFQDGA
jgi:hypothetical protein